MSPDVPEEGRLPTPGFKKAPSNGTHRPWPKFYYEISSISYIIEQIIFFVLGGGEVSCKKFTFDKKYIAQKYEYAYTYNRQCHTQKK